MILGIILGLISAFIWATTSLAIKEQAARVNPLSFNAFRMVVATIFTFALLPFFGGIDGILQTASSAVLLLSISSIIGIAIGDALYFWSMTKIGASRALPLSGTYPLFTWALAVPLLGEPITAEAMFGTALVVGGVYLLSPGNGTSAHADARTERLGMVAAIAAAALWAVATTMLKIGVQQSPGVIVVNAIRLPVAAIASILVAQWYGGWRVWDGYTRQNLPRLIALAMYSTGIGMIVWTLAVDYAGAARAALLNTAAPLIGVPLSVIFLHERVTRKVVMGTLLAVCGVWLIL
ncbi:MAG: DMT family transporter [Chloroflexi bacterium]|nr:DMT family transporter [Chloroflexota bacterium]